MERQQTAGGGQLKDRISNLPDEVIHDILARLRSTTEPAKLAILSKRWNHLWLSYPVFHYTRWPIAKSEENLKKFLTATTKKFSALQHVSAVRIRMYEPRESDLLDKLLGFVAKVTQEVFFAYECYVRALPPGLFDDDRFRSLKVVKLKCCKFPSGTSIRFGASLQVLRLNTIMFSKENDEGDRILNSMIERASRNLETLSLKNIYGVQRFRIRDCLRLKTLKFGQVYGAKFEISGAQSLEVLHVRYLCEKEEESHGTLTPNNDNVKALRITCSATMTNEALNKFISKFPRLESLELIGLPQIPKIKVTVTNHKFLRVIRVGTEFYISDSWPEVIEIDAPWLSKFVLDICNGDCGFPDILINKAASEPVLQVSVRYRLFSQIYWHELKRLLATLNQFRLNLEFFIEKTTSITSLTSDGDDESPIPTIEDVKFPPDLLRLSGGVVFMNNLFRNFNPKMLSFAKTTYQAVREQNALELQKMWKYLDSSCKAAPNRCHNHQLKGAKMMKRVINDDGVEEDKEINLVSFLDDPKRCWIILYWS